MSEELEYYISTGDLAGYYTLRYRFNERYYVSSGDGMGGHEMGVRERDYYVCNLSTDREEAISKAVARCGKNLKIDFDLDEIKRRPQREIDWSVMRAGKYIGKSIHEVREQDPNYLMWLIENMAKGRDYIGTVELAKSLMSHELGAKEQAKAAKDALALHEGRCFLMAVGSGKESLGKQIMTSWSMNERSSFMQEIGHGALAGRAPYGRRLEVAFEILAKESGRRGSKAYQARLDELFSSHSKYLSETPLQNNGHKQEAAEASVVVCKDYTFAYHVTLREFLPSIAEKGLLPNLREGAGEVIFVEPDQEDAEIYAAENTVTLRFPVDGFGCTEDGECVIEGIVAQSSIEVSDDGKWKAIAELVVGNRI